MFYVSGVIGLGSLPHRQLRNKPAHRADTPIRSLPHRQLRKQPENPNTHIWSSLPHRQLRNVIIE